MTLRRKTQVYLGITMLVLLLLLDLTFTGLLRASADKTDRERLLASLSRTSATITGEAVSLSDIADNWAHSDDTYKYMSNQDHSYVKQILNKDIITEIGISSVILVNKDNEVILFKDFSPYDMPSTPESEFEAIAKDKDAIEDLFRDEKNKNGVSGVALKDDKPVLFAVKQVLPSDRGGEPEGILIATKAIDSRLTEEIAASLAFNFTITPATEEEREASELEEVLVSDTSRKADYVAGKLLVRDHLGRPAFWINGKTEKYDIFVVEKKMQHFFLLLALAAIIVAVILDLLTNHILFRRMKRLSSEVSEIREGKGRTFVTEDRAKDEITELQSGFNELVAYMNFTQEQKRKETVEELERQTLLAEENGRRFRETVEAVAVTLSPGDGYFRTSILRAAAMTKKFCLRLGMTEEEAEKAYFGALFSRIGQITLPQEMRNKTTDYTYQEQMLFRKYPLESKEMVKSIPALRDAFEIPVAWNENWDGTGFPRSIEKTVIPLSARVYAIVDMWNELTRSWPGRRMLSLAEVEHELRHHRGTRFDPALTDKFIEMIREADSDPAEK